MTEECILLTKCRQRYGCTVQNLADIHWPTAQPLRDKPGGMSLDDLYGSLGRGCWLVTTPAGVLHSIVYVASFSQWLERNTNGKCSQTEK